MAESGKNESPINCNSCLADIYAGLEMHNFAYAHNSYVVNLKYVAKVEGNLLVLMDGQPSRSPGPAKKNSIKPSPAISEINIRKNSMAYKNNESAYFSEKMKQCVTEKHMSVT